MRGTSRGVSERDMSLAIKQNFPDINLASGLLDDEQNALVTNYARRKKRILATTVLGAIVIIIVISVMFNADELYLFGAEETLYQPSDSSQAAAVAGTDLQKVANCNEPYWGKQCTTTFAQILGKNTYFVLQILQAVSSGILVGLYSGALMKIYKRKNVLRSLSVQGIIGSAASAIRALDPVGWGGQLSIVGVDILHNITICTVLTVIALLAAQWVAIDKLAADSAKLKLFRNLMIAAIWISLIVTAILAHAEPENNVKYITVGLGLQIGYFVILTGIGFVTFWRLLSRMESYYVTKLMSLGAHCKKRTRILSYMCSFVVIAVACVTKRVVLLLQQRNFAPRVANRPPEHGSVTVAAFMDNYLMLLFLLIFARFLWNSAGVSEESKNDMYKNGVPEISPTASFVSSATAHTHATFLTRQTGFTYINV